MVRFSRVHEGKRSQNERVLRERIKEEKVGDEAMTALG
jgi:hypothetical protein